MRFSKGKYWVVLLIGLLLSCKEDIEITPATYSKMLTGEESKSWKEASFTFIFNDEEVGEFDANTIYGIPECAQDDIYTFIREGKQLEVYEGNDKCDPEGDDLLFRTRWDVVNANASLFVGGSDFVLTKLTEDSLVYGFRDTLSFAPFEEDIFWELPGIAQWVYKPTN